MEKRYKEKSVMEKVRMKRTVLKCNHYFMEQKRRYWYKKK